MNRIKLIIMTLMMSSLMLSCNQNKNSSMTDNNSKDTTWYNIPTAKIIYPFDRIYKFNSEEEKQQFLIFQFSLEDYLIELANPNNQKYVKCPTLNTEITVENLASENTAVGHAMYDNYISTMLFFVEEGKNYDEIKSVMKELKMQFLRIQTSEFDRVHLAPLLFNGAETRFIGYILPKSSFGKYASIFNWENLKSEIRSTYISLDISKFQKDLDLTDNENVVILGLTRSFELNPDVIEVVDLSANNSESKK